VLKVAKESHKTISYDPNYHPLLWDHSDNAKEWIIEGLKWANIVKISDDEVQFITGEDDMKKAAQMLAKDYQISLLFMTKGKDGSLAICNGRVLEQEGLHVQPVDTTGAGDSFMASVLHQFLIKRKSISELTEQDLSEILQFANTVAAYSTTIKGGFSVVPTLDELEKIVRGVQHV
jgi:sugar/nucleoside kinase (ribokinase family)